MRENKVTGMETVESRETGFPEESDESTRTLYYASRGLQKFLADFLLEICSSPLNRVTHVSCSGDFFFQNVSR